VADAERASLGARGEDAAAAWYRDASYVVLDRNWRCAQGELDVVASSAAGDVLVFCEVKTRSSAAFGSPFEAVTLAKQRRGRRVESSGRTPRRGGAPRRVLIDLGESLAWDRWARGLTGLRVDGPEGCEVPG
jgi:putative endonuclease